MIFTKEKILDIILSIIEILDLKDSEILEYYKKTGSETGPILTYEIIYDNKLQIDYGWTDYEEGENNTVIVSFSENEISLSKIQDGYSVYGGDYNNTYDMTFDDSDKLIEWLTEEI